MAANTQDPAVEEAVESEKRDSYAVWAIPPDDVCRRIKKLMEGLRAEFGGPEIEPHIPIAGSIRMTLEEALEKFQHNSQLPVLPYVAKVDAVVTRPSYYQCLCLLFHRSYELETATRHCCGHFRIYNNPLPHLGLIYGNLTEEERKKAQQKVFSLDESITSLSFQVNRIALYKIDYKDKTLKSREKIAERSLHFT